MYTRELAHLFRHGLEDVPVGLRFPAGWDRRGQGMDERVEIGRIDIVLFIPRRGRKDDVRVQSGRIHAEVDIHNEVELTLSGPVASRFTSLVVSLPASSATAFESVPKIMAEKILMPLRARHAAHCPSRYTRRAASSREHPGLPRRTGLSFPSTALRASQIIAGPVLAPACSASRTSSMGLRLNWGKEGQPAPAHRGDLHVHGVFALNIFPGFSSLMLRVIVTPLVAVHIMKGRRIHQPGGRASNQGQKRCSSRTPSGATFSCPV